MRIGEFAEQAGVTPRMLRHYEQENLLQPAARGANGYRDYDAAQLPRAQQVRELLGSGLPARIVRDLLDSVTDDGGIDPAHVDPSTRAELEDEWARMCRCLACIAGRRDALRAYLDALPPSIQ